MRAKFLYHLSLPNKWMERLLVVLTSLLLAIWMMRDTIALRNILLVSCTILSLIYLYKNFQEIFIKYGLPIKNWMPIFLLGLLFIWVVTHFTFFSIQSSEQLHELRSTWLRGFMASIIGFSIGSIINRNMKSFDWIMLALISGFVILFCQYIHLVLRTGEIYQQMWWNSVYWGKVNQVLLGVLFIGGCLGDLSRRVNGERFVNSSTLGHGSWFKLTLYGLGILLIMHCYVFEIDTRNGIALSLILMSLFVFKTVASFAMPKRSLSLKKFLKSLIYPIIIAILIFGFSAQHFKKNMAWSNIAEDISIALQVERYDNWQSAPSNVIYTPTGRKVPENTYERVSWVVVALDKIPKYPLGYGLLHNSFGRIMKMEIPSSSLTSSHCGWLDFGLSFGLVGLILILASILWTVVLSVTSTSSFNSIVLWMSLGIIFAFTVGELMVDHGVEFLFFWLVFLPSLLFSRRAFDSTAVRMSSDFCAGN
jgi:hypothetical protein